MKLIILSSVATAALIASANATAQDPTRPDPESYSTYIDGSVSPALLSYTSIVPAVLDFFASEATGWTPDDLSIVRDYAKKNADFRIENKQASSLALEENCRAYGNSQFQGVNLARFLQQMAAEETRQEEFARTLYEDLAANLSTEGAYLLDQIVREQIAPSTREIRFDFARVGALADEHADELRTHISNVCSRNVSGNSNANASSSSSSSGGLISSSEN